jgi:putative acyl-CoA dehydrogenase
MLASETARLIDEGLADEYACRPMSELMARTLQGAELLRHSTTEVVDAFFASRASPALGAWGSMFGTLTGVGSDAARRIVERARVIH